MAEGVTATGLPRFNRMVFASASLGGSALGRSKDLWLLYFYAPPDDADIDRRTSTLAVGVVLFLLRFLESFDDPLIGYWSDHTRSRWGRRIPFVLVATPLHALCFVLLWLPPIEAQDMGNAAYLFVVLIFFHLFSTLSGGPFESLLPEIARTHNDRISITTWQVAFGVVGAAIALVASGFIVDAAGFVAMGVTMAVLQVVFRYAGVIGAWRPAIAAAKEGPPPAQESFRTALGVCLRNDQLLYFLPTYIFYNMGVLMITGVIPFLVKEVIEAENEGTVTAIINAVAIGALVAVLPGVAWMARTQGKHRVYAFGMAYAAVVFPLLFFIGLIPGVPVMAQALVFALFMGLPLAPLQTFQGAFLSDISDYDTLRTGARREGMYFATQAFFEKVASSLAPLLLALLLTLGSTTEDPLGIRLVGPVAGLSTFIGWLAFRGYWLPDEVTEESVRESGHAPAGATMTRR